MIERRDLIFGAGVVATGALASSVSACSFAPGFEESEFPDSLLKAVIAGIGKDEWLSALNPSIQSSFVLPHKVESFVGRDASLKMLTDWIEQRREVGKSAVQDAEKGPLDVSVGSWTHKHNWVKANCSLVHKDGSPPFWHMCAVNRLVDEVWISTDVDEDHEQKNRIGIQSLLIIGAIQ